MSDTNVQTRSATIDFSFFRTSSDKLRFVERVGAVEQSIHSRIQDPSFSEKESWTGPVYGSKAIQPQAHSGPDPGKYVLR